MKPLDQAERKEYGQELLNEVLGVLTTSPPEISGKSLERYFQMCQSPYCTSRALLGNVTDDNDPNAWVMICYPCLEVIRCLNCKKW